MRVHCSQNLESLYTADLKFTELCTRQAPGKKQTARSEWIEGILMERPGVGISKKQVIVTMSHNWKLFTVPGPEGHEEAAGLGLH